MTTLTVKAPQISCGHCVHTIQNEVGELAGVKSVQAAQDSKLVTVTFEAPATREQIEKLMAEIGYPAEPVAA
ncbi:MAG: heavy-metal-associated domain-containing protein [Anaerolineales bacterium]|nr:heavy-metal-associated domain-containing protein [Anaerolineales bacterium]